MSSEDMVEKFLKTNGVKKCADDDKFTNEKMYLMSKSHRTAYDYGLDPIWDGLMVKEKDSGRNITFYVATTKTTIKAGAGKRKFGATVTYKGSVVGMGRVRENTITERIASGMYKIIRKPKD